MQNEALEALNIDRSLIITMCGIMLFNMMLAMVSYWKLFTKAGQPGWKALIPFYNVFVFLKIINKPCWWFFLFIVPGVNIVFGIWSLNLLVRAFGKDEGYTVASVFFPQVFLPALAFDKNAQYAPPAKS
jgi:hypothetical protein